MTTARVLFDYVPKQPDELALKVGETISILEQYDDGWCKGEIGGKVGVFPKDYVKIESGSSGPVALRTDGMAVAIMDHEGVIGSGQLSFKKGDTLKVLEKFPTGWWKGEINGSVGTFPKTSVTEEINASRPESSSNHAAPSSSAPKGYKAVVSHPYQGQHPGQISLEVGKEVTIFEELGKGWVKGEVDGKVGIFPGGYVKKLDGGSSEEGGIEVVAIHAYSAKDIGQLSFEAGANLIIYAKLAGGWCRGKLLSSGEIGIFPGSFVKEKGSSESNVLFKTQVTHDFQATSNAQISIKVGQIINVIKELPNGWWMGECEGKTGVFPSAYTKRLDASSASTPSPSIQKKLCVAQYDYIANEPSKLSFKKGENIYLLQSLDKGWSRGEKDGKVGLFPSSYVKLSEDPKPPSSGPPPPSGPPPSSPPPSGPPSGPPSVPPSGPPSVPPPSGPPSLPPSGPPPTQPPAKPPQLPSKPVAKESSSPDLPFLPSKSDDSNEIPSLGNPLSSANSRKTQTQDAGSTHVSLPTGGPSLPPGGPPSLPPGGPPSLPPGGPPSLPPGGPPSLPPGGPPSLPPGGPPSLPSGGPPGKVPPPPPPPKEGDFPKAKTEIKTESKPEPTSTPISQPKPGGGEGVMDELAAKLANRIKKNAGAEVTSAPPPQKIPEKTQTPSLPIQNKHVENEVESKFAKARQEHQSIHHEPPTASVLKPPSFGTNKNTQATNTQKHVQNPSQVATGVDPEELLKVKRALVTLQGQAKTAIDGMLARIDNQQKEFLKLVSVIREMKVQMQEEQKKSSLLEQQNRKLYTDLQALKAKVDSIQMNH